MNTSSRSNLLSSIQRYGSRRWRYLVTPAVAGLLAFANGYAETAAPEVLAVREDAFKCLTDMVKVRHFFVDNLRGNREATVEIAKEGNGMYPTTMPADLPLRVKSVVYC